MTEPLEGCWAKIERAKGHIAELESQIVAGRDRDYRIVKESSPDQPGLLIFRSRVDADAMTRYGVIVGDIAHNLRSALDNLVWQLVLANGQTPDRQTGFPVFLSVNDYRKRSLPRLHGVSADAQALIESVQPYHTPNDTVAPQDSFLWLLNELSNEDKHHVVNVTAGRVAGWSINISGGLTRSVTSAPMPNPRAFGPLTDGDVVHTIDLSESPADLDPNYEITLGVAFREGPPGRGRFVVQLLNGLVERVASIVDMLAPHTRIAPGHVVAR